MIDVSRKPSTTVPRCDECSRSGSVWKITIRGVTLWLCDGCIRKLVLFLGEREQ